MLSPTCPTRCPTHHPCALMEYQIVDLDKFPGVCPIEIKETLCQYLSKLVLRAVGDQLKTACGNIQL